MTETTDRALQRWLAEGPDRGSTESLARALAATRRTPQRPGWTFPERWVPMQLTFARATSPRPILLVVLALLLAAAVATIALLSGSLNPRLEPYGPAANGQIAYANDGDIYVANADGTGARALRGGAGTASAPTFSLDGTRVAYWFSERGNPGQLIVANADGTNAVDVLGGTGTNGGKVGVPAWSPDGSVLAFAQEADGESQVVVARADRVETRVVLRDPNELLDPSWSRTGSHLAVRRVTDTTVDLLVVTPAGTGATQLVSVVIPDPGEFGNRATFVRLLRSYAWLPAGDRIAFFTPDDVASVDLRGNVSPLLDDPAVTEYFATWSPDGKQLAFFAATESGVDLIVASADGTGQRSLGLDKIAAFCPIAWSPDGALILGSTPHAACDPDFAGQLLAVDVATGAVAPFTGAIEADGLPTWQRLPLEKE